MSASDEFDSLNRHWPALVAVTVPVGILLWQSSFQYGWIDMALGSGALIFWLGVTVWLGALVLAVRRKHWWALTAAPLILYPIVMSAFLLAACATGNCL